MSHLAERFESAVLTLVGDGPVKHRLAHAFTANLEDVEDGELPEELRSSFSDLRAALHREAPLGTEPCVVATVRKMSVADADRHASSIVRIYGDLVRASGSRERLAVVNGKGTKRTPKRGAKLGVERAAKTSVKPPRFLAEQGH